MTVKNMWGDIDDMTEVRPPHEIIEEQGKFLEKMSKGTLEMKIERKQSATVFNYDIYIVLPSMNHRQRIFRLTHDFKLYPANLYDEQGSHGYKSKDQEEFEQNLGKILSSTETMTTISKLMAQARLGTNDILV
ncbi:MAG: hypothetical protein U9R69_07690 [Thermodesulfobacteriota bacterium]|nr:hypothetical protein [Thermodesulfobacteriota bacterium]